MVQVFGKYMVIRYMNPRRGVIGFRPHFQGSGTEV